MSHRPDIGQSGHCVGFNHSWPTASSSRTSSGKGGKSTPEMSPPQRREEKNKKESCQACGHNTKSKSQSSAGGNWAPYLPKPTAKSDAQKLRLEQAHGGRAQCVADARRLWSRLAELDPEGPEGPEAGFSDEVARYARYGREYIRKAPEQSTAKSRKRWRGIRRSHLQREGAEEELFEEYEQAVRKYRGSVNRRMQ